MLHTHLSRIAERRSRCRAEGFGSLFSYCTEALRLSEQAAYKRILAARAGRRFLVLLDRLAEGSLNLSTVCQLAPHLTPENHQAVLSEAAGRSKREDPSPGAPTARSRHIPAEIKRAVWLRDRGRCAFVAESGRRCRERTFLEFHHVESYGIGGETTVANLSLRCRTRNQHEAELVFGPYEPVVRETREVHAASNGLPPGGQLNGVGSTIPGASWRAAPHGASPP